jgi:hypothetical protein
MQAVENFCSWRRSSISSVEVCDALCNLRVPSRFGARLGIGFHANEESVCEGDALVGWQD